MSSDIERTLLEANDLVTALSANRSIDAGELQDAIDSLPKILAACGISGGSKSLKIIRLILLLIIIKLLLNRKFGLKEIKREIRAIEARLDQLIPNGNGTLTTGPVIKDVTAGSLVVKVLNNTDETQTVVVLVWDLTQCPKALYEEIDLELDPQCTESEIINDVLPLQYEVQFVGMVPGVYGWTATRTQAGPAPLEASSFIAANTFRHAELVPLINDNDYDD